MRESVRKTLFRLHSWSGLQLGFLLFAVCFSGTVAVFSAELNWLADPSLRAAPPGETARPLSWQEMHDRVAEAYPHASVMHLAAPHGKRFTAQAAIAYAPQDVRRVSIDPYTGEIKGQKTGFNLVSFLRIFHKQFYIVPSVAGVHGTWLTGVLAVFLLSGAVTGVLSVKRWWRSFFLLRRGRSPQLFWSDMHRLTGVWALLITLVLSVTGIWYFAERALFDVGVLRERAGTESTIDAETLRALPPHVPPLDLDRAARAAQAAFPELEISQITLPVRFGDPVVFSGQAAAWLVRARANQVHVDPYTGRILGIRRAEELTAFARWRETADPLHFGTFAGLPGKIVWFAAGLAICGAIGAGLYGAWLRQKRKDSGRGRVNAAALVTVVPALIVMLVSLQGVWRYGGDALRPAYEAATVTPLKEMAIGPWQVSLLRMGAGIAVLFDGPAQANFVEAGLSLQKADGRAVPLRFARFADRLLTRAPCEGASACKLHLEVTEWDGTRHHLAADLTPKAGDVPAPHILPRASGLTFGEQVILGLFALCLLLPFPAWAVLLLRRPRAAKR